LLDQIKDKQKDT